MIRRLKPRPHVTTRAELLVSISVWEGALGVTYLGLGVTESRRAGFEWLDAWVEPPMIGAAMIVAAALCAVAVIVGKIARRRHRDGRPARVLEQVAFALATIPHLVLVIIFVGATIAGTHPSGWVSAISYVGFGSNVYLMAGVMDPPGQEG